MNDFTTLTCALCAGSIFAVYQNRTHVSVLVYCYFSIRFLCYTSDISTKITRYISTLSPEEVRSK